MNADDRGSAVEYKAFDSQTQLREKIMAKKEVKPSAPADKIELYEKLIKSCSQIDRKGATIPYTSLNGRKGFRCH